MPTNEHRPHSALALLDRPAQQPRLPVLQGLALLLVATCLAYLPAMQGQILWDDDQNITKPELRSLHGLNRIWFDLGATEQYYPLLHSAFWMECQLWGDRPLGYHVVTLLLHVAAAWLVYLIVLKLQIPGALLAAAIFALHPVQAESVAWITEQKNTLSTVFYLSAMLAYLHFDEARSRSLYAAALGLFVMAILSKTVTATLPAALLVIFWWQRGRISWRHDVQLLLTFFLLGAISGLFTAWVERTIIGAEGSTLGLTFAQRIVIAGAVPWFYLGKLLWPAHLIFMYPRWSVDPKVWWQWLFPLASIAMLVALWFLRRRWRGPLAGWLFFIGTLFPVMGLLNVYWFVFSFVGDHLQYVACLGEIVPVAAAITLCVARLPRQTHWIGNGLCLLLLIALATLTWRQSRMYGGDAASMYRASLDGNPNCWLAHYNLANTLRQTGQTQDAIEHYLRALQIRPDYVEAHNNLGNMLFVLGRTQEAIQQYQQVVQLKPEYAEARSNLAIALAAAGKMHDAIQQFEQARKLQPANAETLLNLAIALLADHRPQEAVGYLQEALRLQPANLKAYAKLTSAFAELHQPEEAIATAQKALEVARSQGESELAAKIEAWLTDYRASRSTVP